MIYFFLKIKGIKKIKAPKYRRPAKVTGGISNKPHLIIIKEVDQRNVTSKACSIDTSLVLIYNPFIVYLFLF